MNPLGRALLPCDCDPIMPNMNVDSMDAPLLEPPTTPVRPYHAHHSHGMALQKYIFLQEQHQALRQYLDELRQPHQAHNHTSRLTTVAVAASIIPSPPALPTRRASDSDPDLDPSSMHAHPRRGQGSLPPSRRASYTLHDGASSVEEELAVGEQRLCEVNEGIKRALTELLNCETVRNDRAMRSWVQCRLMDAERELRMGRRRRSGASLA
ncbi:uncharacterized protein CTHT_0041940 [Thermochaetoides thermophila DSM 1495]|uniref:Uncharacterized protein n=1 Tax=Chaetomium thermophilum (strain DSM 1495 / CBS 144.50 / IMI 039719) TaxID=759272 RepID=G0SAE0_CHATD|nr:hypothetical protein CTHT_0041940 [Thermochaetoides thermophila DSM 1495]EGS19712.1 hypothetical protein CTHT_0041940 [Thermochaetoides thermophila DSM 1495]